jgi:predicted SAM-dependent methyltransferase
MELISREKCAICLSSMNHLYTIDNMPIKCSCTLTPQIETSPMIFSICDKCNTIQLDKLIPLDILYSSSHNIHSVGKTWEGYFKIFLNKIENLIKNKNILEIGDPSGKIANYSVGYNNWYIIEPNKNKDIKFKENIHFIKGFFDDTFSTNKSIDVIIHSHVFEHIYSPNDFLKKCYDILSENGEMFFGVPNMEYIVKEELSPCLGIFFEHTIFLNKENIKYLLEKNGFELIEIYDYESHSTLYHAKKINTIINMTLQHFTITNYKDAFMKSIDNWSNLNLSKTNNIDIYVFGASYNTQFLLSLSNIKISGILDNCKEKQGKYFSGYLISSPNNIIGKTTLVIVRNGYYSNEIINQLRELNQEIDILY